MQRIKDNFSKQKSDVDLVKTNEQCLELVTSVKMLGVTVTDDLKWSAMPTEHSTKSFLQVSLFIKAAYKHTDLDKKSSIKFYCACIRSILEYVYACQTFHSIASACHSICPATSRASKNVS